jgi:RHS repeat-associated protein
LLTASDDGGWSRQFAYDPFGNIWMPSFTGIPPQGGTMASVNNYNAATNHINGASYDAAGNLTGLTGMILDYDAENRQKVAYDTIYGLMLYLYDGSGQRIEKKYPDASFGVYVYDAFGQLAAEYYSDVPAPPPCTTCYLSWDHLGSARLVTDQWGNMVSRHDYLPFGEEIASGSAGRNSDFGQSDNVNQKFTGQEHDSELGLDFFKARYFSAGLGRFTSPDPLNAGANSMNPQSWNGYSYVGNNPLALTDPGGMSWLGDLWGSLSQTISTWIGDGSNNSFSITGYSVGDISPEDVGGGILSFSSTSLSFSYGGASSGGGGGGSAASQTAAKNVGQIPPMVQTAVAQAPNACLAAIGGSSNTSVDRSRLSNTAKRIHWYDGRTLSGTQFPNVPRSPSAWATTVPRAGNVPTSNVILWGEFWNQGLADQLGTLFHETTHVTTRLDDQGLVDRFQILSKHNQWGLPYSPLVGASELYNEWLVRDGCPGN